MYHLVFSYTCSHVQNNNQKSLFVQKCLHSILFRRECFHFRNFKRPTYTYIYYLSKKIVHHVIHLQKSKTEKPKIFSCITFSIKEEKRKDKTEIFFFLCITVSIKRKNIKKDFHMHHVFKNPKTLIRKYENFDRSSRILGLVLYTCYDKSIFQKGRGKGA